MRVGAGARENAWTGSKNTGRRHRLRRGGAILPKNRKNRSVFLKTQKSERFFQKPKKADYDYDLDLDYDLDFDWEQEGAELP